MQRITDPRNDSVRVVKHPPAGFMRVTADQERKMGAALAELMRRAPAAFVRTDDGQLHLNRAMAESFSVR